MSCLDLRSMARNVLELSLCFGVCVLVQGCEREVAEAQNGSSDELLKECIMRLSWALVHSRQPEDVQRGIGMLEGERTYPRANGSERNKLLVVCVFKLRELICLMPLRLHLQRP